MTDMSNSSKKTLVERVADKIQSSEIGIFFTDDDLTDVVKQAIEIGFFKDRTKPDPNRSYGTVTLPPLVVEMAREAFKENFEAKLKPIMDELFKNEEFLGDLGKLIMQSLLLIGPEAVRNSVHYHTYQSFLTNQQGLTDVVVQSIKNKTY